MLPTKYDAIFAIGPAAPELTVAREFENGQKQAGVDVDEHEEIDEVKEVEQERKMMMSTCHMKTHMLKMCCHRSTQATQLVSTLVFYFYITLGKLPSIFFYCRNDSYDYAVY